MRTIHARADAPHAGFARSALVATLSAAVLAGVPSASIAACTYSTLEKLPDALIRVNKAGLRRDLLGARSVLDEPLFGQLPSVFDACTPSADDEPMKRETLRSLALLREEVEYQIAKGVSDPRLVDPDDVQDMQRVSRRARDGVERYYSRAVELSTRRK